MMSEQLQTGPPLAPHDAERRTSERCSFSGRAATHSHVAVIQEREKNYGNVPWGKRSLSLYTFNSIVFFFCEIYMYEFFISNVPIL